MLLSEPGRTQGDLFFTFFGIPVRIHPFFWLIGFFMGPWRTESNSIVLMMLVWFLAFFVGILLHELGHAFAMRAYGFQPHITLYGLGGMASYGGRQNWPTARSPTLQQIVISAAGPAAGFVLAGLVAALLLVAGYSVHRQWGFPCGFQVWTTDLIGQPAVSWFVNDLLFVTVVYGILNLMPIYPLDGGQIAREVFVKLNPHEGLRRSWGLSFVTAALLAVTALVLLDMFVAFLFGYLAYFSYANLQAQSGRGRGW